ncbi:hypothetical protein HDIA_4330 [Hartmannibacter diazotrophicus]|uniref:Uncharacterized protein n=1 Tax=Hartmannibacter diazotrophicus TaxID=1482074 RepID=A0A2C9DDN6_9HYPH|nr:hypothetical protein [Hartmannibacter diazotrophicus]SON57871.1 hypothetical protein HDIA_4330 [Hartmannibacter diazotrophicus]
MDDPLLHIHWRLWKVQQLTIEIRDECRVFLTSEFFEKKLDMKNGTFIVRFGEIQPFPDKIAVLIGEAAYLLRSSLDHLMFQLAKPEPGKEHNVEFPIVSSKEKFKSTHWKMPGVPRGVRSRVESVQPYHSRKRPNAKFLWQLRDLNNWDKHRLPPIHMYSFDGSGVTFKVDGPQGRIIDHKTFKGYSEEGKIIATAKPTGYWNAGEMVYPEFKIGFAPVFDHQMPKSIRDRHPLDVIAGAGNFIEHEVIPMFEEFFSA